MSTTLWTSEEEKILYNLYLTLGHTEAVKAFCSKFTSHSFEAVGSKISRLKNNPSMQGSKIEVPRSALVRLPDKPLIISGDRLMITSDWHVPAHSTLWCNRMLKVAMMQGITTLVVAGDFLDVEAFSTFLRLSASGTFDDELEESEKVLETLLKWFDKVYWFWGNHELRFEKMTLGNMSAQRWANAILTSNKIHVSKWRWAETEDKKWRITHPKSYSQLHTRVANRLAIKERKNIMSAHGHRVAQGFDDSGLQMIIDTGGLFDRRMIEYLELADSIHPRVGNGFVTLINSIPVVYAPSPWTAWDELDNMGA